MLSHPLKRLVTVGLIAAGAVASTGASVLLPRQVGTTPAEAAVAGWTSASWTAVAKQTVAKAYPVESAAATVEANVATKGLKAGQYTCNRIILRQAGTSFYNAELCHGSGTTARLQLQRLDAGKITVLATKALTVMNPTTARRFALELRNVNGNPVLKAAQWAPGTARPAWQLTATDASAAKLIKGVQGSVSSWVSGSGTHAVTSAWSGLSVVKAAVPVGYLEGWGEPVFRDEFTSDTLGTRWAVRDKLNLSYDWAQVRKENAAVGGGVATLETRKLAQPVEAGGRTREYSSAYIDSIKTQSQSYGRWEIRAKLPPAADGNKGIWPAFWLRPDDAGHGEIDIFEYYGTPVDRSFSPGHRTEGTVHFDSINKVGKYKVSGFTPLDLPLDDGKFHVWAVEWTPQAITFFVDGRKYYSVAASSDTRYKAVYASGRKYNMRLNVQVGSEYWGGPDDALTAANTTFAVDYVRVWTYRP